MPMLDSLKPWIGRFDRLSLRERGGIAAATAALLYFILSLALVGPNEARRKALGPRLEAQQTELAAVRKGIGELTSLLQQNPNAQQEAQLDGMKRAIAEADALLAQLDSAAVPQAGAALKEVLGVSPGLELVSLKTLPVTLAFQSKPTPAAPAAAAKPAAGATQAAAKPPIPAPPPRSIYRHGIEISIKGNYLTLLPYLEKLQKYPGRLYWTDASLDVQTYPDAVLKLTVYTLSGQANPRLG